MQTISLGVRDTKINLSKLLKLVKQGQEVVITDRGKPVGKIVPLSTENLSLTERIKHMEEQGWIEPLHKKKEGSLPPPLPAPDGVCRKNFSRRRETHDPGKTGCDLLGRISNSFGACSR